VLLQASLAAALVLVSNLRDLLGFLGVTSSLSSAITVATLLMSVPGSSSNGTAAARRPSKFTLAAATFFVLSTLVLIAMMFRHDSHDLIRTAATLGSGAFIWLVMKLSASSRT